MKTPVDKSCMHCYSWDMLKNKLEEQFSVMRNSTLSKENRPSMMDVARLAGLSKTTVSYVLNNNPSVTEENKARVLEACERLG